MVEQFITENDNCKDVHVVCGHCGVIMKVIVMKALTCFANTLINNYSNDKCEDIITSKVSRDFKSAYNNRELFTIFYYNSITLLASYGHVTFITSRSCKSSRSWLYAL